MLGPHCWICDIGESEIWRCWVHIVGFDGRDIGVGLLDLTGGSEIWRCWVHIVGFDGRDIGVGE